MAADVRVPACDPTTGARNTPVVTLCGNAPRNAHPIVVVIDFGPLISSGSGKRSTTIDAHARLLFCLRVWRACGLRECQQTLSTH